MKQVTMSSPLPNARRSGGFTVIELIVTIVFLALAATFLLIQRNDLQATARDQQRKTAVNAFYYSLENVYYPSHGSYPDKLSSALLPSVDPSLFTDTNGKKPTDSGYEYRYEPTGCNNGSCKNYSIRVTLQKEAAYVKSSAR